MRCRQAPPPEALTAADVVHIVFAFIMVPLGVLILVRTLQVAVSPLGILVGLSFSAFGIYRLRTAWMRYRLLRQRRG
ncbi:MAG: hypothetical protein ACUVWR_03495 [Anaerolineae bacterium]